MELRKLRLNVAGSAPLIAPVVIFSVGFEVRTPLALNTSFIAGSAVPVGSLLSWV
ncbi:hypothetical protein D3C79_1097600 [compost metagenome]